MLPRKSNPPGQRAKKLSIKALWELSSSREQDFNSLLNDLVKRQNARATLSHIVQKWSLGSSLPVAPTKLANQNLQYSQVPHSVDSS